MTPRLLLLTGVLAAVGCGSASPVAPPDGDEPIALVRLRGEPLPLTVSSGLTQPQRLLVHNRAEFLQVWAAIWRNHLPAPAAPDIDFSRDMVVVAALGEKPTGGYGIFIESAAATPSGVTFEIRSVSPGSGCGTTLALTQPVDVARLPRRAGTAVFTERQEVQQCR